MKTFLSIGSGPGIGIATAERFAQEDFRVVLTSRDPEKLGERASQLSSKGYTVSTMKADAGNLDSVLKLISETEAEFGAIDVLHFNSASIHSASIETQAPETFVSDLTINIGAALVATQAASRGMLARGSGAILMTGGALATHPHPDYLLLGIGKAGIQNLTQGVFDSFRNRGVHVASVTVATFVTPDSPEARGVAQAFWDLYTQPREGWTPEVIYPAQPI
ncbi:short-chain dehydrogenase [Paraburkholderia monticola]|uniref:Short-chain dehydrogenase n=1 Tax=Paraburkholderia monticola TaxID=1399968 RepID=A0A149PBK7_9BURK|nr:SDR family NAD(P)-dependent oxidoreductase [Paraburkholderia monticola]KXU82407.1 short-chain dehydrogenase [Paraburkholderia monticola]